MTPAAILVADLGFGDAGKGTLTDWLVRRTGAGLVVRFNGGAQAGHTVVCSDGRAHTFAQFGAGTFVPGVRTHLSRYVIVHPGGLWREAEALARLGVRDALERLTIAGQALLITPFLQAAGRLRELLRGASRHGSCGIGVGESVHHSLCHPEEAVHLRDLEDAAGLRRKLLRQQARLWEEFAPRRRELLGEPGGAEEMAVLESAEAARSFMAMARPLSRHRCDDGLPGGRTVVFEGAQGVLLDEWRGFHPYTTWSTCTFDNALELLRGWDGPVKRLGVLRSYATRHGAGPFPTEDPSLHFDEPHNHHGPWQGRFRQGWPDLVLLRYALEVCGGVDGLAVTHLDRLNRPWRLASAYDGVERLLPGPARDLAYQEGLTRLLETARPVYAELAPEELLPELERALQVPIWVESRGPGPAAKQETQASHLDSHIYNFV